MWASVLAAITAIAEAFKVAVGMKVDAATAEEKRKKQLEDARKGMEWPPPPKEK